MRPTARSAPKPWRFGGVHEPQRPRGSAMATAGIGRSTASAWTAVRSSSTRRASTLSALTTARAKAAPSPGADNVRGQSSLAAAPARPPGKGQELARLARDLDHGARLERLRPRELGQPGLDPAAPLGDERHGLADAALAGRGRDDLAARRVDPEADPAGARIDPHPHRRAIGFDQIAMGGANRWDGHRVGVRATQVRGNMFHFPVIPRWSEAECGGPMNTHVPR